MSAKTSTSYLLVIRNNKKTVSASELPVGEHHEWLQVSSYLTASELPVGEHHEWLQVSSYLTASELPVGEHHEWLCVR